jgi:hypothetical protein
VLIGGRVSVMWEEFASGRPPMALAASDRGLVGACGLCAVLATVWLWRFILNLAPQSDARDSGVGDAGQRHATGLAVRISSRVSSSFAFWSM